MGYDWSGFYAGAHLGWGWGDVENSVVNGIFGEIGDIPSTDIDGILGGAQIGYNHQFGFVVGGVEADFSLTGIDGEVTRFCGGPCDPPNIFETEYDWLATVRGRLGLAFGRVLVYGTGGLAIADIEDRYTRPGGGTPFTSDETAFGWTAGGGVEVGLTNRLSIKAEYLHADFGDESFGVEDSWGGADAVQTSDHDLDLVRGGVNFRF